MADGLNQMGAWRGKLQPAGRSLILATLSPTLGCRAWRHISGYGACRDAWCAVYTQFFLMNKTALPSWSLPSVISVNRIIQSDKQRACTKATYQPPVKNSWRPREAGICSKTLQWLWLYSVKQHVRYMRTIINRSTSSDRARNHLQMPCRFSLKGSGIRKGRDTRRPTTSYQVGVK